MTENKTAFVPEMPQQQIHACKGNEAEYHTEGKMKHCQEGPGLWVVRCHACNKPFIVEVNGELVWGSPDLIQHEAGVRTITESEALQFAAWYSDRCNEGSDYTGELTIEAWRAGQ